MFINKQSESDNLQRFKELSMDLYGNVGKWSK